MTGAQPLLLERVAGVEEEAGVGDGVWVWFSGRGESLVGDEGWEQRRLLVREVIRPKARMAFPVF